MGRAIATGERVTLHRPRPADRDEFLTAVARSRTLHEPWVYPPSTPAQFNAYVRRVRTRDVLPMLVHRRTDRALVGVINLNHIIGGALQQAVVGYYAFEPFTGNGYMTDALTSVVRHCFDVLGLHRVEANIQPGNLPSRDLARRVGFEFEGLSPRYLRIGGAWRDHERYAIVAP